MRCRRMWQATLIALASGGLMSGCYYDPNTGLTSPYPPPYGYPQPAPGAEGMPYAGEPGMPPGGGGMPYSGEPGMPPGGEATGVPPGPVSPGGPPAQGDVITRDQFIQNAMRRATRANRNPQVAAQRAGTVFDQIDVNHVGAVTREQIRAWREARRNGSNANQPPSE
jgi:hypothetical protein